MKIKILAFIVVLIMCIAMLVACSPTEEAPVAEIEVSSRFILVESFKTDTFSSSAAYVIVDTETNVCYLLVVESQGAGLTVMVDAEGNPLLWEGSSNNWERKNENLD